jgi:isopenicillin N synthase-like dioxygenase
LRSGAHTDYGTLTFIRGDDTPGGLQVKHRNGDWIEVHPDPKAFVCNIGDLMARWSNDRWVSTLHRVAVPPPEAAPKDRISLVFFQIPNHDATISCIESCVAPGGTAKHQPIKCSDHYLGKLMKASHARLDANAVDAVAS